MKIATYNVNGVNGRLSVLLRWLEEDRPDVACLQELRAPQERFPQAELRRLGYDAIWHGQKSWNGVAILSRLGLPRETRRGLPGDPDDIQSRYIEAELGGLLIGCIYLPNGNPAPGPKFDYKIAWFERLVKYAARLMKSGRPAILCGDFNAVPTPLDAYKPERWVGDAVFFPETRALYARLLKQGWTDALRTMHPEERGLFTYWDYFRNAFARNAGIRMDHFLLSPALAPRLTGSEVSRQVRTWEKTSDHAPVWIELRDKQTRRAGTGASKRKGGAGLKRADSVRLSKNGGQNGHEEKRKKNHQEEHKKNRKKKQARSQPGSRPGRKRAGL